MRRSFSTNRWYDSDSCFSSDTSSVFLLAEYIPDVEVSDSCCELHCGWKGYKALLHDDADEATRRFTLDTRDAR
jgi:hypothetical protein